MTSRLLLDDLGVLDHGDAATLSELAFQGDAFTAVLSELLVDWLVFANDQIRFAFAYNTDRPTALDALRPAGLAMFFANRIMIDVAHHIDYFAGHFFGSGRVAAMLMFLRDREWSSCQCDEHGRSGCDLENRVSVCC
jgi:hypothetical protein